VLRLWPETINICLFPGVAWIQKRHVAPKPVTSIAASSPLDQLRTLLDAQEPPLRPGTRIALTVSDTAANIVAMPWQAALQRAAEIDAYAHACFQQAGLTMGDGWTMHAEFRARGAMGLAYALPNALLEAVLVELAPRQLALANVLPLSAALYFGTWPRQGAWPAVLVARERGRHVACVFGPTGLIGYDIEAIVGNAVNSKRRLEGRIAAQYGAAVRRAAWEACDDAVDSQVALGHHVWQAAA
jgi:hypothetical protein